ncbi:MAG: putative nuclease of restriction endonuclease-like (RecB) superfamily [Colwellia sp.]|jgi:predicted nuclease of restriction endonuclease-like (RecB) superfamily
MKRCNHEGSMNNLTANTNLVNDIRQLLDQSRQRLQQTVNSTMVQTYWQVGCLIVEDEQQGKSRANYGKKVLKQLASVLTIEFGKGFDERNLRNMRLFYINFPIRNALRTELSWTHYRTLIRIENEQARQWYLNESIEQAWSARALERQIGVLYYERLLSSKDGKDVKTEATEKTLPLAIAKENYLRDPYILEFLNLPTQNVLETDIEHGIIDNLQKFILELGKGFAFVERQQRISTQDQDFYIDLVFYNFKLKCFLLIDLKIGKLTHQDVGQMDTYVRMYDQLKKQQDDNPTIGLILCSEKSEAVAKYSVLADQKQLFASKYLAFLPTEEELRKELERERLLLSNDE